ncbi:MAG: NTP transferase domain-containing protein [Alphaproteobacteria bacterium]|nr:NTP transferase domain-containing protein [Alphaproteobacteria bacterium]
MSSTRLPAKVLQPLCGKPLIWHIIHRLKKSRHIETVVVATSSKPSDNPLEDFCKNEAIPIVRGSLKNVLARVALAAEKFPSEYIVRVAGDAPLIEAETIDKMIELLEFEDADRIFGDGRPTIHCGFEVVSSRLFATILKDFGDDPVAKEHVTGMLGFNPNLGKGANFTFEDSHVIEGVNASVDTPADQSFITALYRETGATVGDLSLSEAVAALKANPALLNINADVKRKSALAKSQMMLFVVQGGSEYGLGHLKRCLKLANTARSHFAYGIHFLYIGETGLELIAADGFQCTATTKGKAAETLKNLSETLEANLLVIDIKDALSKSDLCSTELLMSLPICLIDDASERLDVATVTFVPPTPEVTAIDWSQLSCIPYIGWKWSIVPNGPALQCPTRKVDDKSRILLTMGGSDPYRLTERFAAILAKTGCANPVSVLIGPDFREPKETISEVKTFLPHAEMLENVTEMGSLFQTHDIVLTAYGMTVLEALAYGCATAFTPHSENDSEAATMLVEDGAAINLGPHASTPDAVIAGRLKLMLSSHEKLNAMGQRGAEKFSHETCENIMQVLASLEAR